MTDTAQIKEARFMVKHEVFDDFDKKSEKELVELLAAWHQKKGPNYLLMPRRSRNCSDPSCEIQEGIQDILYRQ